MGGEHLANFLESIFIWQRILSVLLPLCHCSIIIKNWDGLFIYEAFNKLKSGSIDIYSSKFDSDKKRPESEKWD